MLANQRAVLVLVVAVCAVGCKDDTGQAPEPVPAKAIAAPVAPDIGFTPAPAGPQAQPPGMLGFALYLPKRPKADPGKAFESARKRFFPTLAVDPTDKTKVPAVVASSPKLSEFPPPDSDSLKYLSPDLSAAEVKTIQDSKQVYLLMFAVAAGTKGLADHRRALEVVNQVAAKTGAFIWDAPLRIMYSREQFAARQLEPWKNEVPNSVRLFTVHSYRDGDLYRMVSLGLEKFGIPDLVINDLPGTNMVSLNTLLNLAAQTLLEGGTIGKGGALVVDVNKVTGFADIELLDGASGKGTITLAVGAKEDGDADNRLLEIVFPGGPAHTTQVRQNATVDGIFGSKDEVTSVQHDDAVLKVSKAALKKLRSKRKRYESGNPEMYRLLVKGPFTRDDGEGREWMWVEVSTWKGDTLSGTLANDPYYIKSLKAGAKVEVKLDSVFDYMEIGPDGVREGNETGKLLQKQTK